MRLGPGDPQKERVYEAEGAAGLWEHSAFANEEEFAEWVCACMQTGLIEERYRRFMAYQPPGTERPGTFVIGFKRKGAKRSHANASGMRIAPHHLCKHVALHELAHIIGAREFGNVAYGHGWQWCSIYLELLGWFTTREIQAGVREEFDKRGVIYSYEQAVPEWTRRIVSAAA